MDSWTKIDELRFNIVSFRKELEDIHNNHRQLTPTERQAKSLFAQVLEELK